MIPGQRLTDISGAGAIKIRINTFFVKSALPQIEPEVITPAVKFTPFFIGRHQQAAKPAIAASPNPFQPANFRVLPFKINAGQFQLILNPFDAVFGFGFLHHVPDWRQGLSEIARVLKPGGVYYIEELYPSLYQNVITKRILLHPEHDRFTSDDLRKALDEAHLRLANAFELRKMGILGVATKDSL